MTAVLCGAAPALAAPALTTTQSGPGLGATELAQTLVGAGVTINSATLVGAERTAGTFQAADGANPDTSIIGFPSGVVLASGSIVPVDALVPGVVIGPNSSGGATDAVGTAGDAQLDALVSGSGSTQDATILEIRFVPTQDQISFQYVFGSEEYNEFVGSVYNDVFAFFVNGVNCATVGDPPLPVAVNTINNGSNGALFRDNTDGNINTQLDGLTTVLTCVAQVNPNVENTLRLAIADTSDPVLDSAVFIKAGSFVAGPVNRDPAVSVTGASGTEGTPIALQATASDPDDDPLGYQWSVTNGAGVDAGASCSFSAPTSLATSITCTDDGTYDVTLTVTDDRGASTSSTVPVSVANTAPSVAITAPADGASVAAGAPVSLTTVISDPGANDAVSCTVDWGDGSPATGCATPHTYAAPGTYTVTATVDDGDGGQDTASIGLTVLGAPALKPLTISTSAGAAYERVWSWDVDKTVANPIGFDAKKGAVEVDYRVDVDRSLDEVRDVRVTGVITIGNPNGTAVPMTVTDTMPGAVCTVKAPTAIGPDTTLKVPYTCVLGALPKNNPKNSARVTWDSGRADASAVAAFGKASVTDRHGVARVIDTLEGEQPKVLGAAVDTSRQFTYRRYLPVPGKGCDTVTNTARVAPLDDDQRKPTRSVTAWAEVRLCAPEPVPGTKPGGGDASGAIPAVTVRTDDSAPRPSTVIDSPLPPATRTGGRLAVSLAPKSGVVRAGGTVVWTVRVTNRGDGPLAGLRLKTRLPRHLTPVGAARRGDVRLGSLAPGKTFTARFRTSVSMPGRGKRSQGAALCVGVSSSATSPAGRVSDASSACVRVTPRVTGRGR